jgi:hypothetical protein
MKADNWLVVLWHRGKIIAGDSLQRITRMAGELIREGRLPNSPMSIASSHTSARAADRAAARLAEKFKADGWWLVEGSAQGEERRQAEGAGDES